jgi:hypothetical protein
MGVVLGAASSGGTLKRFFEEQGLIFLWREGLTPVFSAYHA